MGLWLNHQRLLLDPTISFFRSPQNNRFVRQNKRDFFFVLKQENMIFSQTFSFFVNHPFSLDSLCFDVICRLIEGEGRRILVYDVPFNLFLIYVIRYCVPIIISYNWIGTDNIWFIQKINNFLKHNCYRFLFKVIIRIFLFLPLIHNFALFLLLTKLIFIYKILS